MITIMKEIKVFIKLNRLQKVVEALQAKGFERNPFQG
jgi:nitrogen regulatory protein PII